MADRGAWPAHGWPWLGFRDPRTVYERALSAMANQRQAWPAGHGQSWPAHPFVHVSAGSRKLSAGSRGPGWGRHAPKPNNPRPRLSPESRRRAPESRPRIKQRASVVRRQEKGPEGHWKSCRFLLFRMLNAGWENYTLHPGYMLENRYTLLNVVNIVEGTKYRHMKYTLYNSSMRKRYG